MTEKLLKILGIKYPIIQGGMAWVSEAELAGAVSNAGGLGLIAAANAPAFWVREQITKIRTITNKPFGVNVMLLSPYVEEVIDVICEMKVPIITTGAGNPGKYMAKLKKHNVIIIPVVPSVAIAKRMEKSLADAVIIEGCEAGGHIGELTTMVLLPQVVDAVNIPVIAAGGIGDARGIVAAYALGACAVQIGTRFICSKECTVANEYKELVIKASDRDTLATGRHTGHPVRCLKTKFSRELLKHEKQGLPVEEFEKLGAGSLRKAVVDGNIKEGTFMAGQISGLICDIKSCEDIINDLVSDTNTLLKKMGEIRN